MSVYLVSKLEAEKKKRTQVALGVSLLVVAIFSISIIFFQLLLRNERIEIESHITEVAKQSAQAANIMIAGDFQTLALYAHLLEKNPKALDRKNVDKCLEKAITNTRFLSMAIAYPDGQVRIYDSRKGFYPYQNVKSFRYFQTAIKGKKFVDFINNYYDEDKLIVLFAIPLKDAKGNVIGVLTASQRVSDFINAIDITAFNDQAVVHIIDNEGHIILRDTSPKTVLKSSIFETNEVNDKVRKEALQSSNPVSYWFKDENGVKKVAAFVPLGYNNWKVLAILPFSSINHNTKMVLRYAILFFLLINTLVVIAVRYNWIVRQRSDNMIMDLALQDDVTNSLNKTSFYIESEKMLLKTDIEEEPLAILVMDIDNFKVINEVYNVKKGDKVLRDIAKIISKAVAENGIYARLNDDNFAIMMKYDTDEDLIGFVDDITDELASYKLNIKLVPSFGIFKIADRSLTINAMCDRANIAKRTVKGLVGERYAFFDESLSKAILEDKQIEDEMKQALEEHQFEMYLQPKISMATMQPCGSEALIRWNHPKKGLIPPYKFIPLFERNGFVVEVDKYIWEEACKTIRKWLDEGKEPLPISVNLSRIHFKYDDLVEVIQGLVQKYNVPQKYFELELTESAFLDNEGAVNSTLIRLQELGFTIAMDDFGVGYSSLNMLRKLPVNVLKLDRGFINEATCTERGFIVLNHVIHMAKDLKATVVCEGIETEEQAETLKNAGCDIAQGFLYAKPMPVKEYEDYVYNHEGANSK